MRISLKIHNHTHYRTADLRPVILGAIKDDGEEGRRYVATIKYARQNNGCSGHAYYGSSGFQVNVPKSRDVCIERSHSECKKCGVKWTPVKWDGAPAECIVCGAKNPVPKTTFDPATGTTSYDHSESRGLPHPVVTTGYKSKRLDYDVLPRSIVEDFARVVLHELQHCAGKHHEDMCDSYKRAGEARGGGIPVPWCDGLEVRKREEPKGPTMDERVEGRAKAAAESLAEWQRRLKLAQTKVRKYRVKVRYYEGRAAAKPAGGS